jgi:hypothetical protein
MKKYNIFFTFLLGYIGSFILCVLIYKNFSIGNHGPFSWREIYDNLQAFLVASFVGAIFITFEYFIKKYKNEKK